MTSPKQEHIMMVLMLLLSVGLIAAVATTVGYATKAASREYEYEMLRKEYQSRIDKETEQIVTVVAELSRRIDSEAYLNKRRYDILSAELNSVCIPDHNELDLQANNDDAGVNVSNVDNNKK